MLIGTKNQNIPIGIAIERRVVPGEPRKQQLAVAYPIITKAGNYIELDILFSGHDNWDVISEPLDNWRAKDIATSDDKKHNTPSGYEGYPTDKQTKKTSISCGTMEQTLIQLLPQGYLWHSNQ